MVLILLLNRKYLPHGPYQDEADQVHQAKVEALLLKEAVVLSPLQNTHPNPELLEEAPGPQWSQRPSLEHHLDVEALDHLLSSPGRPEYPVEAGLPPHHQKLDLELHPDVEEVPQCLPQSQQKSRGLHGGGAQLHLHVPRQRQGEAGLLLQNLVDCRGPAPDHAGRKQEQPDEEIGLGLLNQHLEEDRGAGLGLGSLGGGEVALVTIQGHLPDRRVPGPPLGV